MNEYKIVREMVEEVRNRINGMQEAPDDHQVRTLIEEYVLHDSRTRAMEHQNKRHIIDLIFHSTRKDLDLLQPYVEDKTISEIMVNGTDNIYIEKEGVLQKLSVHFECRDDLEEVIRRIAAKVHREINELQPVLDARLEDGSRVSAIYKNIALNGPILTIRRFPERRITMDELIERGSVSAEAAAFLEKLVAAGYNIFISGGTSSGKTTFLNVLSNYIPKDERVIVIEDSSELQITEIENLVRMETKNANVHDKGEVTIRQLIRASLRMRPDRIIVGEVRGGEVMDMIQAMNTGHDGSISTGHGNSPEAMLCRLEAMFLTAANFPIDAIRNQIASAIDIMVHLGKLSDKSRKVLEISEVEGYDGNQIVLNPLFRYQMNEEVEKNGKLTGSLVKTSNQLKNRTKLLHKGMSI